MDERGVILVVEDEPAPQEMLRTSLAARGFEVHVAGTGRDALELVDAREPDVVIVDLGLPDMDGLDLCRHIRARTRSSIIVVTADGTEARIVQALDEGADDYVIKPFSMPELLARVRVAVRRTIALGTPPRDEVMEIGTLRVDPRAFTAHVSGQPVQLPHRQFKLLVILARNVGQVVGYRTLVQHLWDADAPSRANALRVLVSGIRQNLGHDPGVPQIVSETHVGYRLVDVHETTNPDSL